MLGPILFIIFINDIDLACCLMALILKFADDTKSGKEIKSLADSQELQESIKKCPNGPKNGV